MRIVLIGFMGSGKTSIASLLAKRLDLTMIETDTEALKDSKEKTINDIFHKHGEHAFRLLESEVAHRLQSRKNIIVSTGGGMVLNASAMKSLRTDATVVFLDTSFDELSYRLRRATNRPLFRDRKKAQRLYDERLALYKKYANITVSTDKKTKRAICDEIEAQLVN